MVRLEPDAAVPGVRLARGECLAQGRFRILRQLGRGGMGVVYEALDLQRDEQVALKLLMRPDAPGIYRLKHEFRSLADTRDPNLVQLHELFASDGRWFFTMELIRGAPFHRWVRPGGELDEARLRAALAQLVSGIRAIHAAGKLHRDLKPSNVLVTEAGRLVVLDFGLVADLEPGGLGQTHDVDWSGSPAYLAPEQASGMPAAAPSDRYAIGVMLFEALTGRLPFEGGTQRVLADKQHREPPAPSDFASGLPDDLERLCLRLLARDPAMRPSGQELLEACDGSDRGRQRPSLASPSSRVHATLHGRDRELELLRSAYRSSLDGAATAVLISAESGMGKTALCEAFIHELRGDDTAVVLAGRCYERESLPFKALDPLVDALGRHLRRLPPEQAAAHLPRFAFALSRSFPALDRIPAVADAPRTHVPDPNELRRLAFEALSEVLYRIADRGPLVLWLDDLQWTDRDSVDFLRQLLRRPVPLPALLIASFRDPRAEDERLASLLQAARDNRAVCTHELTLEPLSAAASETLATQVLASCGAASGTLARRVAAEGRGSPLWTIELARFAARTDAPAPLACDLGHMLRERLSALAPSARSLTEVTALAGQQLPLEVALDAAKATHTDLDAARGAQLVRSEEHGGVQRLACHHDRIREAVCAQLPAERVRAHYAALARALAGTDPPDLALLSRCLEGAGERQAAARAAARAGEQAVAAMAFDHAAALFARALALGTDDAGHRAELTAARAHALACAGYSADAASEYQRAAALSSGDERNDLRRRAAEQLLSSGHVREGMRLLREVCGQVGVRIPRSNAAAIASFVWMTARLRLRGLEPHRSAGASPRDAARLQMMQTAVSGLAGYSPVVTASLSARYLWMALENGEARHVITALGFSAHVHVNMDSHAVWTRTLIEAMQAAASEVDDHGTVGLAQLAEAAAAFDQGRGREARNHVRLALEALRRCSGVAWHLDVAALYDQLSAYLCGDFADIARTTPALIEEAFRRGRVWTAAALSGFGALPAWLAPDDPDGYLLQNAEAARRWTSDGTPRWPDLLLLMGETMARIYSGEPERGLERLEQGRAAYMRALAVPTGAGHTAHSGYIACMGGCAASALRRPGRRTSVAESSRLLSVLRSAHDALRRSRVAVSGTSFAGAFEAAMALHRGDVEHASKALRSTLWQREQAGLAMQAAATRVRLGQLLGGDEGKQLVASAERFMSAQGVRNVDAMTELYCPGCRAAN